MPTELNYHIAKGERSLYNDHISNEIIHIVGEEREKWNKAEPNANNYTDERIGTLDSNVKAYINDLIDRLYNDMNIKVPIGMIMWYPRSIPPIGWLVCNGQSTLDYPELAVIVGPNVPDLRGEFIRGWDQARGVDTGRTFGSWQKQDQDSSSSNHRHYVFSSQSNNGTGWVGSGSYASCNGMPGGWNERYSITAASVEANVALSSLPLGTASGTGGGNETRPRNIALLPCIKY